MAIWIRWQRGAKLPYMGRARKLSVHGLKVAGLSGIYHPEYFEKQRPPLSQIGSVSNKKYIYFTESEVEQLAGQKPVDILIFHEWPSGIIDPADEQEFEQQRRSLRYDSVGNEYAAMLIELLEPTLVLCGHMHRKYHNRVTLNSNKQVDVHCLASVHQGADAYALYSFDEQGHIELVEY